MKYAQWVARIIVFAVTLLAILNTSSIALWIIYSLLYCGVMWYIDM